MAKRVESIIGYGIFASRWIQAPLYAGLIVAQVAYAWKFGIELWHLIGHTNELSGKVFLGGVLELIDFVMVANLITMVAIGGYATFVSKLDIGHHPDRPDWLDHIDPGAIKVKLAGSLIGISSIQLLQSFISVGDPVYLASMREQHLSIDDIYGTIRWQIILHIVFIISALMLALTEMVMARRHRVGEGGGAA
jgi:uncharacterized protein (TIGR00645 family)